MAIVLQAGRRSSFGTHGDVLPDPMMLEKGDQVAIVESRRYDGPRVYVYTVERVTATQIVLEGIATRYYRKDGAPVGRKYGDHLMHVGHPQVIAAKQADVIRRLKAKSAELLDAKMHNGDDRLKVVRSLELCARQAAERMELLVRHMDESQAEIAAVLAAAR